MNMTIMIMTKAVVTAFLLLDSESLVFLITTLGLKRFHLWHSFSKLRYMITRAGK